MIAIKAKIGGGGKSGLADELNTSSERLLSCCAIVY
jgi:hypothetical protein